MEFKCAIVLRADPACPRNGNSGSWIHLLWRCLKLQRYWAEVGGTGKGLLDVNLLVDPFTCLLGYVDFSGPKLPMRITAVQVVFMDERQIVLKWTSTQPPTIYD